MKFKRKKNGQIDVVVEYSDFMSRQIVEAARRAGMSSADLVLNSHAMMMDMARAEPDRLAKAIRLFVDGKNAQSSN